VIVSIKFEEDTKNGYFYVSYYDTCLGNFGNVVFTAESPDNYKNIYQYDPLGWCFESGYRNPIAWCANVFTAKSNETLKAVSFYTTDTICNYEINIYTDPGFDSPLSQVNPVSSKNGVFTTAGYHTVTLDSGVQLNPSQRFSVVLNLTNSNYYSPIAVEKPIPDFSDKAIANASESYISPDGTTWEDLTIKNPNSNVCIKAFTDPGIPAISLPISNFSETPTMGTAPLSVAFTDTSTGSPTAWNWDFGDGANSTEQNPTHTYSVVGTYTVNLTVSNANGKNSKFATITVFEQSVLPVANFISNVTSGNAPLSVQFADLSMNTIAWNWDFGDGAISSEQNPMHTYSAEGIYNINLIVSNANGTASKTGSIAVSSSGGGSSHSGGGSSGSGGGFYSPELKDNIENKESSKKFVANGNYIEFDFPKNVTPVVYIAFDAKATAGMTTTIAEELKKKSILVSELPSDEVYKSINIWARNNGFITPKNIENAVVCFKVEKSWIMDRNINKSSITLNRYSDKKWDKLPTSISGEDAKYMYFTAETPGFSSFAITGRSTSINATRPSTNKTQLESMNEIKTKPNNGNTVANVEHIPEQNQSTNTSGKDGTGMPGFTTVLGTFSSIMAMLACFLYLFLRK
jgi:PGF-pre-PGF domain-containing protein